MSDMTGAELQLREELAELMHEHFVRALRRVLGLGVIRPKNPRDQVDYDELLALSIKKYNCLSAAQKYLPIWHADEVLSLLKDLGALR